MLALTPVAQNKIPMVRAARVAFQHRWLILELVKREVKVRYRGTWLGFLWTMLNPLVMTAVYTLVFAFFLRIDIPKYSAFLFCALLPWNWFSEAITLGTDCLISHPGFLRDAIFPSEVLPVISIATAMMNYLLSLPVLVIILLVFKVEVGWSLIAFPAIVAVQFLFSLGLALFLGTLNVMFRDLRYIVQLTLLALFFLTPIFYAYSTVPAQFTIILKLNPVAQIINGYRQIFFYNGWPAWDNIGYVFLLSIVLIFLGAWLFESRRESFAEYL